MSDRPSSSQPQPLSPAQVLGARARILASIRRFFDERGYLEVETPLLVPSPGLDVHLDAFEVPGGLGARTGYLITSPEYQMKRLLSDGLPRIYQLARCFRQGEAGRRHNPEFTMLEWYTAGAGADEMMTQTEQLVRHLFETHHARGGAAVGGSATSDGGTTSGHATGGGEAGGGCDVRQPFARLTVAEAFERYAGVARAQMLALAERDEERFFLTLIDKVEPALGRLGRPVFLYDYPAQQASLARLRPNDPAVAERFELYVGDWELCNGFGELTDHDEQRARLLADQAARRQLGKPIYPIDERFLQALQAGMPASAGNALGVDRLVALLLDRTSVGEVMAFSQDRL